MYHPGDLDNTYSPKGVRQLPALEKPAELPSQRQGMGTGSNPQVAPWSCGVSQQSRDPLQQFQFTPAIISFRILRNVLNITNFTFPIVKTDRITYF